MGGCGGGGVGRQQQRGRFCGHCRGTEAARRLPCSSLGDGVWSVELTRGLRMQQWVVAAAACCELPREKERASICAAENPGCQVFLLNIHAACFVNAARGLERRQTLQGLAMLEGFQHERRPRCARYCLWHVLKALSVHSRSAIQACSPAPKGVEVAATDYRA